jgi:hypothetical protein
MNWLRAFFIRERIALLFAAAVALLILWTMLLPGYILSLDLVFGPHYFIGPLNTGGFINSLPISLLLKGLYYILPGWVIEKIMLLALFFIIPYFSYKFLPVPKKVSVQIFAALIYTANLFVYDRMLAGQWLVLYSYAFFPLFLHYLFKTTEKPSFRNNFILVFLSAVIGIFSLQFFVLTLVTTYVWLHIWTVNTLRKKEYADFGAIFIRGIAGLGVLAAFTSYWWIPSLFRAHPIEASFGAAHWQAFAASGHGHTPVLLNLSVLGGFWEEGHSWANYFAWPQDHATFWIAACAVLALVIVGLIQMFRTSTLRSLAWYFSAIGIIGFVCGTGAANTIFAPINIYLYQHVTLWDGFRDSQKFVALLALSYAVFAGYGFDFISRKLSALKSSFVTPIVPYVLPLFFIIPILFGMFEWGGFAKQLRPVWYPQSWYSAEAILQKDTAADLARKAGTPGAAAAPVKVLILPWQGYFSLSFNNDLITANPAQQFFGQEAVISQNVRLDQVYDQSQDPSYMALDYAIRHNSPQNGEFMDVYLKSQGIGYVLFLQDIKSTDTFTYQFLQSPNFTEIASSSEIELFRIN